MVLLVVLVEGALPQIQAQMVLEVRAILHLLHQVREIVVVLPMEVQISAVVAAAVLVLMAGMLQQLL
jgi:hypothetical protein